jgi:hypothetical protein
VQRQWAGRSLLTNAHFEKTRKTEYPICITIEEVVQIYKTTHRLKDDSTEYEAPLNKKEWSHPAERITLDEVKDFNKYTVEIYIDGSKHQGKVSAAAVIFKNGELKEA